MQKNQLLKKFVIILLGCFACLFLLLALLPSIASTEWGQRYVISMVNQRIPGNISVKKMSLSWFGPVKIEGFSLTDPKGETVITFDSYTSETPLLKQFREGPIQGTTHLDSLQATIYPEGGGGTNLDKSLGLSFSKSLDFSSIFLTDVNAELHRPSNSSDWTLKASGHTKYQNTSGQFVVDIQKNNKHGMLSQVKGDHFPSAIFDLLVSLIQPQWGGILSSLVGETTDFLFNETLTDDGTTFTLAVQSPRISADFKGTYEQGFLTLDSPAKLKMTLPPLLLQQLTDNAVGDFLHPIPLELTIHQLKIPTKSLDSGLNSKMLEGLLMTADLQLPKIEVKNLKSSGEDLSLKDVVFTVKVPEKTDYLDCRIEGFFDLKDKVMKFVFDFQFDKFFMLPNLSRKVSKKVGLEELFDCLPTPSSFQLSFEEIPSSLIDAYLETENRIAHIFGEKFTFRIRSTANDSKAVQLALQSEKLNIPNLLFKAENLFDLTNDSLKGTFSGQVQSKKFPQLGRVEGIFTLADFMTGEKKPSIHLTLTGKKIPSELLGSLTGKEEVGSLFGSVVDVNLFLDCKHSRGPVDLDVVGEKGFLSLQAHLSDNGLTLAKPLIVEFEGNTQIGHQLLGQWIPIFNELISGDLPINLTICPENFFFPIFPFDSRNIRIDTGVLTLGKLHFHHRDEVKKVIDIFRPVRSKTVSLWTTPLYFSMKEGVLTVERMDMLLLDRYALATWGKIDFIRNQVKMVLGLGEQALSLAFNIKGLEKDAMVQIPIHGKVNHPKINRAKLATQIGSLLAKQSEEETVISTLLNFVKGKERPIPPPTTKPLPWNQSGLSHLVDENKEDKNSCQ